MSEVSSIDSIFEQPEKVCFTHLPLARKTSKTFELKKFPQKRDQKIYGHFGVILGRGSYVLSLKSSKYTESDLRYKFNPIFFDEKIYSSYVKASKKQIEMEVELEREINHIRKKWQERKERRKLLKLKKEKIYKDLQKAFQQEIRKLKHHLND